MVINGATALKCYTNPSSRLILFHAKRTQSFQKTLFTDHSFYRCPYVESLCIYTMFKIINKFKNPGDNGWYKHVAVSV